MDSDKEPTKAAHLTAWANDIEGLRWANGEGAVAVRRDPLLGPIAVVYRRTALGAAELDAGLAGASIIQGWMLMSLSGPLPQGFRAIKDQRP